MRDKAIKEYFDAGSGFITRVTFRGDYCTISYTDDGETYEVDVSFDILRKIINDIPRGEINGK